MTCSIQQQGGVRLPDAPLLNPGVNCWRSATAARASLLIDAESYFSVFAEAASRAREQILILAWDFDSRTPLTPAEGGRGIGLLLGDFLNRLVRRNRRLRIHILDWDYPMIFGTDREFPPIYGLGWTPRRRIHLRYDNTHPMIGSHHQKVVVIDDALAFSGGLDLTARRWDTCEHLAKDPRRMVDGEPYPPFHDVMGAVDGEAALAFGVLARDRWFRATGETLPVPSGKSAPWPPSLQIDLRDVQVGIARTEPAHPDRAGVREIERLYLDMIGQARRYIYIENQYFTSRVLGDALAARLAEPEGPEVILVSRLLSHGWLEEHTMHLLRTQLLRKLRASDVHGRFDAWYPHIEGLADGTCVDVHSKVMIVDDRWLRIGSANLCNRSMGMDTECDLVIDADSAAGARQVVRGFRNALLGEHLGMASQDVQEGVCRHGSIRAAIPLLGTAGRGLRRLEDATDVPDAVVSVAEVADPEEPVSLDSLINEFHPARSSGSVLGRVGITIVVVGLFAFAAAWRYTPLAEVVTPDRIFGWAEDFSKQAWAPVIVLLAYIPASVLMFPRPLITLFAVVSFGPWLGFSYAMGGILIAALSIYAWGRTLRRDTVRRLAGARLNAVSEVLRRRGFLAVTVLRLVPVAPFLVGNLVSGAIRVRVADYTAGTAVGMLPGLLAATIFADQLQSSLRSGVVNWWLIAAMVTVLVAGIYFVGRWFRREMARGPVDGRHGSAAR